MDYLLMNAPEQSTTGTPEPGRGSQVPPRDAAAAWRSRLTLSIPLILLLIFTLDLATPLGLSIWLLYCIPLVLCLWSLRSHAVMEVCGATLILLTLGYILSPPGMQTSFALFNRTLFAGIFVCIAGAIGVFRKHAAHMERELDYGREIDRRIPEDLEKTRQFFSMRNTRIVSAIRSMQKSLPRIRGGTDPKNLDLLTRAEKTLAGAEETIRLSELVGSVGKNPPEWQDLCGILREKRKLAEERGLTLVVRGSGLFVFADPMLPQVFDELIDNAVRHGIVARTITVAWQNAGENLAVTFEDDGIGIPFSQKRQLFHDSVGTGLVLAREILGVTGITISETGIPEQGARFTIMVPEGGYRSG